MFHRSIVIRSEHIVLGENNAATDIDCDDDVCADRPQRMRIARIAWPPNYNVPAFANDVAVVTLSRPAVITDWVVPICLPFAEVLHMSMAGEIGEVVGWGLTDSDDDHGTDVLQTLRVPIHPMAVCRSTIGATLRLNDEQQLCVGGRLGEDSCGGDSGGPLVKASKTRARYFQFGIVSVGSKQCGDTPTPAVYTNVRFYLRWILNQMS